MQYHAIPCNTMQYYAIQCNTMQYHAILFIINNCWRSIPLPCGQYDGHFLYFKFQGCWLPFVSFLCARWGRVQRGREEGEVDICQVCSATIRILFIWISKISVKLSMYLSDVEHHKKKRMTRWARYNSPFTYMTRCNSTYSSNMTRDLGMILFKEMQARPMLVWIPSFSC